MRFLLPLRFRPQIVFCFLSCRFVIYVRFCDIVVDLSFPVQLEERLIHRLPTVRYRCLHRLIDGFDFPRSDSSLVTQMCGSIFLSFSLRFDTFPNRSHDGSDRQRRAWIQEHHSPQITEVRTLFFAGQRKRDEKRGQPQALAGTVNGSRREGLEKPDEPRSPFWPGSWL